MDRRPIPARSTSWAEVTAKWLAGTGITPNAVSVLGMLFGILAGASLAWTRTGTLPALFWILGGVLVGLRLAANMFDGMVADIQKSHSAVGSLYNEIPDRISDAATLIGLGYAAGSCPALGWAASLLAVMTAYVRAQAAVSGAPQDFRGPMAKPHRMAAVIVTSMVMAVMIGIGKGENGIPMVALGIIVLGTALTALRRLWTAAAYLNRSAAP